MTREFQPETMTEQTIGKHKVRLIKSDDPEESSSRRYLWHAYCVEYFGDHVPTGERVEATDTSFNVATAEAVNAYANSGEYTEAND